MAAAAILLAAMMLAMAPGSPLARPLRRWLLEKPVAWLGQQSLHKLALLAIGFMVVMVLAIASPELLPFMGALGDTAILEVALAIWLAGMAGGLLNMWRRAIDLAALLVRVARHVATRRRRARPRSRHKPGQPAPPRPDDSAPEPRRRRAFA